MCPQESLPAIESMTLAQKVGQMFLAGFDGCTPTTGIEDLIRDHHLGGVILFSRNVNNPEQVYRLNHTLQAMADLPLLIAIDQEGGMVTRIRDGVTALPGNMALGAGASEREVQHLARINANELRLLGINMNYAPCVDVNNNPNNPVINVRSYGEDPARVAELALHAIHGHREGGVAPVAKHFPGHGDTEVDSHLGLPVINHDRERLDAVELVPFKAAIAEDVDAIMVSHVVFPAIEPDRLPATLSPRVIDGLLRQELGYEGVVTTDCMEMQAITDQFGPEQAAVLAVKAGNDQILVSHSLDYQVAGIQAVLAAVEHGEISEARIDASVHRILRLKAHYAANRILKWSEVAPQLAKRVDGAFSHGLSEKSLTLVSDTQSLLPLKAGERTLLLMPSDKVGSQVEDALTSLPPLHPALISHGLHVDLVIYEPQGGAAEIRQLAEQASDYAKVIIATANGTAQPATQALLGALPADKTIQLALRAPYDLGLNPALSTRIAAYENTPLACKALGRLLCGEIEATGRLPVTL